MKALFFVFALLGTVENVLPCIPVTPDGKLVGIASERAVIAWDADTKTEYFVREANFLGPAEKIGFLVPTPTKPDLSQGSSGLYYELDNLVEPPVMQRALTGYRLVWGMSSAHSLPTGGSTSSIPTVIGETHVGGYDAISLRADDVAGLAAWLKKNGFASTQIVQDWLAPYVRRKWIITAFKVEDGRHLAPVCMAFKTDEPFYPYKEPASQKNSLGRSLRVYFFSQQRYDATVAGLPWRVQVLFSDRQAKTSEFLFSAGVSKPDKLAKLDRLTVFEDRSNPRDGRDDIVFRPGTQSQVRPEPVILTIDERVPIPAIIWLPGAVLAALLLGFGVALVRRFRALSKMADATSQS